MKTLLRMKLERLEVEDDYKLDHAGQSVDGSELVVFSDNKMTFETFGDVHFSFEDEDGEFYFVDATISGGPVHPLMRLVRWLLIEPLSFIGEEAIPPKLRAWLTTFSQRSVDVAMYANKEYEKSIRRREEIDSQQIHFERYDPNIFPGTFPRKWKWFSIN